MKKLLSGVAVLPFLAATAFAQPMVLNEKQMDTVTAGWSLAEIDRSNTSWTEVLVYTDANLTTTCDSCYLNLRSGAISVFSQILDTLPSPPS